MSRPPVHRRLPLPDGFAFVIDAGLTATRLLLFLLIGITPPLDAAAQAPVIIDDDFRHGDHGWTGFFADYPPGVETDWTLESGLRPLPAELGQPGTGFLLSGNNHSDDLAMLMKKPLGPADGLLPNTNYRVNFVIEFASNAPSGALGVGGSPGDSVYLKAGASTGEPGVALDGGTSPHYRPTVNVGIQAIGGPAATVTGVIANGRDAGLPPVYVTLTRGHTHPFLARTDDSGKLWLLVLTDSAFEGPTALFYQRIQTTLTPVASGTATRLVNLSARAAVQPGEGALIAGVVVGAPGARLLVRGAGPALADFGVDPPLPNPTLRLHSEEGTVLAANDNWGDAPDPAALAAAMDAVGAFPFPSGSADAALLVEVPAGNFTAVVEDATGSPGIGLVESYEITGGGAPAGRLLNLSARAILGRDASGIFPGLVVQGPHPERFLVRAVGPGLLDYGVANPAVDPVLELYRDDEVIAVNHHWEFINDAVEIATAAETVGAFPLAPGSADAALVVTLEPGAYTLRAAEADPSAGGVALIEVFRLP